ncbi:hypothetical protein ACS0TY_033098 [Phlomoides rotata]
MNEKGRLLNVFWRDSMMQENFGIYGDIVVFDITYKANKYDLICAPFVGDLAITKAIEKIFLKTRHRLCIWHLQQNVVSKFADLKCNDTFKETFNKCLKGCKDREEFENCWK